MTLTEFAEGFKAGKYALVCEDSKRFYDFCDLLEPLLRLDHKNAWYANKGINFIGKFVNYYCVSKRFGVLFMNTKIGELDGWATENENAAIQNGKVRIGPQFALSLVYRRDVDNDCANFEELL